MATTRGTTPIHVFITDVDLTDAEVIYVTYKQKREILIEKTKEQIEVTSEGLTIALTQEETLMFKNNGDVRIQIRARFSDGSAIASNIIETKASEILKEGVI